VKAARREYQRLREHVAEYDVVVAHELDRLGRSFADLASFIEALREKSIDIDLVNQPIGTVGEDDWMAEMMVNMIMVFADAERKMIRSRVQEGIDAAIADGKRVGRPPFGYTVEEGFLQPSTCAHRTSSARCATAARSKRLPHSSRYQTLRSRASSRGQSRTTPCRSTMSSGGSTARGLKLARRISHRSTLGTRVVLHLRTVPSNVPQ
jgi:DNA invertase Pin-like site-specific DNA recombinase